MIDEDFIKLKIFKLEESKKIQVGDHINNEIMQILKQGSIPSRRDCFADSNGGTYLVDVICNECGKIISKELTKTSTLNYLRGAKTYLCDDCFKIEEERKKEIQKQQKEKRNEEARQMEQLMSENTDWYISNYISPTRSWNEGIPLKRKIREVIYTDYTINHDRIYEAVQELTYDDFLCTPYWEAISLYAKSLAKFKCQLCNSTDNLRTHHKTYNRHGYEHIPAVIKEDLIVLCEECHAKFHDI